MDHGSARASETLKNSITWLLTVRGGRHIANHIGSMMDCKNFVRTHRPHANGATWGFRNHRCYAESAGLLSEVYLMGHF